MSVLKHLKTLQHVSIFSDHLQGARRFLVEVTEFKRFFLNCKIVYAWYIIIYIGAWRSVVVKALRY